MAKVRSSYSQLIADLSSAEGLTKQVSVGNVRELVGILADKIGRDESVLDTLMQLAQNRLKRRRAARR